MSSFPKFLRETERKQTVSHGLTIISDNSFAFFFNVSKERLKYHNINVAFALYGSACQTICEEEIKKDTATKKWYNIFDNFKLIAAKEGDSIKIWKYILNIPK